MTKKIAKGKAKQNKSRMVSLAMALAASLSFNTALAATTTSLTGSSIANSSGIGGTITPGSFDSSTQTWQISLSGSGGIINWSSLGVGSGERLQFAFSGTSNTAAVLNRVTGGDISQIAGTIASDGGKVFLVNPNGIIFASGAAINAPVFVATTLAVTDAAFTNYATGASSTLLFSGGTGAIQVTGPIDAGNIALIAPTVTVAPGVTFTNYGQTYAALVASDGSVSIPTLAPTTPPPPPPSPTAAPTGTNPVIQAQQSTTSTLMAMFTSQLTGTPGGTTPNAPQTLQATNSGGALFSGSSPGSTMGGTPGGTGGFSPGGTGGFSPGGAGGFSPGGAGGFSPGGTGGFSSGGAAGGAPVSGPSAPGGTGTGGTPPADSGDRAMSVVAMPPPVVNASIPVARPPQTTTQLTQGLSQMVTGGLGPPSGGVPGIRGDFSSSGNPGRW